jgi:hypothetical protein
MTRLFALLLLLVLVAACARGKQFESCTIVYPSQSDGATSFTRIKTIVGGPTKAVVIQGDYAYVGVGASFVALDITSLGAPVQIGSVLLPGEIDSITLIGEYAYVSGHWQGGPRIVDVSVPGDPVEATCQESVSLPSFIGADSNGDYIYLAAGEQGLRVFDVTNPTVLEEMGHFQSRTPLQVQLFPTPLWLSPQPIPVWDVVVVGDFAFLLESLMGYGGKLRVLDISRPTTPREVAVYEIPDNVVAIEVMASGNYVFISSGRARVDEPMTIMLDVADPFKPTEISRFPGGALVAVSKEFVYFANLAELSMWDISAPVLKTQVGQITLPFSRLTGIVDAVVTRENAFVAAYYGGLYIIDITNPTAPVTNSSSFQYTHFTVAGLFVEDEIGYLASGGVHIMDFANLDNLVGLGVLNTHQAVDITVVDDYAYILSGENRLLIADISDPTQPAILQEFELLDFPVHRIAADDNYIYLLNREGRLRILDIANFMTPQKVGESAVASANSSDITVSDGYIYLTSGENEGDLWILNVEDPAKPITIARYRNLEYLTSISVSGKYAYVISSYRYLNVFDIKDPYNPVKMDIYDIVNFVEDIHATDRQIYISLRDGAMILLEFTP